MINTLPISNLIVERNNEDNQIPRPGIIKINLSIENYLKEIPKAKLLMPCGHKPKEDDYYSRGADGSFVVHKHEGWYTVDICPELESDLVADLNNPSVLEYIFRKNTWELIYLEYISIGHLTDDFYSKAFASLKSGGSLIFCASPMSCTYLQTINIADAEKTQQQYYCITNMFHAILEEPGLSLHNPNDLKKSGYNIKQLQEYLDSYYVAKIGFEKLKIYVDSVAKMDLLKEAEARFNRMQVTWERKIAIMTQENSLEVVEYFKRKMEQELFKLSAVEVAKTFSRVLINDSWEGETTHFEPLISPNARYADSYLNYCSILKKYDESLSNVSKPRVFAIATKSSRPS
ncbi:MAG: hypothetical protein K0S74_744 [Chlamydiales bacterium]|jgi:hypothetical protein|nr:hypothetical protein [Chlamydiales bacterium]